VLASALYSSSRRFWTTASWLAASAALAGLLAIAVPALPAEVIAYGRLATIAGESRILYAGEGLNASIAVSLFGKILQFHVSGKCGSFNCIL